MTPARRVKQVRSRVTVRRWEFRQRHLARGAWHRFRLALAAASEAYAIDERELETFVDEGCRFDDRGAGLDPAKQIVWISAERAATLPAGKRLEMRLDASMLAARRLALVPFRDPAG